MDVERELAAVRRRIRRQVDDAATDARIRIDELTPMELAQGMRPVSPMEAIGAFYRELHDAFAIMVEDFARGWNRAGR